MPSDRAIRAVIALRKRQAEQRLTTGMRDPTGNAFNALIGEAIDESWNEGFEERGRELVVEKDNHGSITRYQHAITVAYEWFRTHEYTGDGLNVCQVLREVSSPEEVAKTAAAEARILADTIATNRREAVERERERIYRVAEIRWLRGFMEEVRA